jgi:hypothetical protein
MSDPTSAITDMMESKYLSYVADEDRGNFTKLVPGLLDVNYLIIFTT